ncbi:hypothetical protein [uncultured Polaribacter sp.]|uniref:hypothetical protein n=1 Tax=uncultured Polaribacter sp. TaxID=174711 RepID=UPI00262F8D28|nr:hypothetical protein [uncultured Polaribacter sp.]
MNPKINIYKRSSNYIVEKDFYFLSNKEINQTILDFKYDSKTSFYIENPNANDLISFSDFLEAKEFNFLYLKRNSDLLFATKTDKAFYSIYIITNTCTKGCVITNKNSIKLISDRFIENSLFDGRKNEARYLKEENWFKYDKNEIIDHPLHNHSLEDIGKNLISLSLLEIDLENKSYLYNPEYYQKEIFKDYTYINTVKKDSPITQQIEKALDYRIESSYKELNKLYIEYPDTNISKKKLKKLPYNYRFLNENKWNITLRSIKQKLVEYFIVIKYTYKSNHYIFDIKGYDKSLFEHLIKYIETFESLTIGIARPLRIYEQKSKSISINYDAQEKVFISSGDERFSKIGFLEFLNNWID